jgi:hypothetical protein
MLEISQNHRTKIWTGIVEILFQVIIRFFQKLGEEEIRRNVPYKIRNLSSSQMDQLIFAILNIDRTKYIDPHIKAFEEEQARAKVDHNHSIFILFKRSEMKLRNRDPPSQLTSL